MTINRLKHFRVMNAETQTQAAKAAGVTQPTYQRWETGKTEIPKSHLAKLAKHFKTTELELLGRHPPKKAAFYDDEAPLDLQYYGECAVHFVGGGEPLVLSISEEAHAQAYEELQSDKRFIVMKTWATAPWRSGTRRFPSSIFLVRLMTPTGRIMLITNWQRQSRCLTPETGPSSRPFEMKRLEGATTHQISLRPMLSASNARS